MTKETEQRFSVEEAFFNYHRDITRYGLDPRSAYNMTRMRMRLNLQQIIELDKLIDEWMNRRYSINYPVSHHQLGNKYEVNLILHLSRRNIRTIKLTDYLDIVTSQKGNIPKNIAAFDSLVSKNILQEKRKIK